MDSLYLVVNVRYDTDPRGVFDTLEGAKEAIEKVYPQIEWHPPQPSSDYEITGVANYRAQSGYLDYNSFIIYKIPRNALIGEG